MYDKKKILATPSNARRLISTLSIKDIEVPEQLKQLAKQDLLTKEMFEDFPIELTESQVKAIQYVSDWEGRALVLGGDEGVNVLLAYSYLNKFRKVLIISPKHKVEYWASKARSVFGESRVFLFSKDVNKNSPLRQDERFKDNIVSSNKGDYDIIVSTSETIIGEHILDWFNPDFAVFDDFNKGRTRYKISNAVLGLFYEIPRISILYYMNEKSQGESLNVKGNLSFFSETIASIYQTLNSHITLGRDGLSELFSERKENLLKYIKERGYKNVKPIEILRSIGVCTELVQDHLVPDQPMVHTINTATKSSLGPSEMMDMKDRISRVLEGGKLSKGALRADMTKNWIMLKTYQFRELLKKLPPDSICAIYVEDNALLKALQREYEQIQGYVKRRSDVVHVGVHSIVYAYSSVNGQYNEHSAKAAFVTLEDMKDPQVISIMDYFVLLEPIPHRETYEDLINNILKPNNIEVVLAKTNYDFEKVYYNCLLND